MTDVPRIAVSACLLGENVRWDGSNKRHDPILEVLGPAAELVGLCPEIELGLGAPREPIRLEHRGDAIRLVAPASGLDHTDRMRAYATRRVGELRPLGVAGCVLKARSPSCGAGSTPIVGRASPGRGLFAETLCAAWPELPVVEETELADREGCLAFLERVRRYDQAR